MRVWWSFMCDDSRHWEAYVEDGSFDAPQRLLRCPFDGLEAVTAKRMPPADRVRVSLVPSTCISDSIRAQVERDDRYYIEVSSQDGAEMVLSASDFEWEEAVERASRFRALTWAEALNRWHRTGLAISTTS